MILKYKSMLQAIQRTCCSKLFSSAKQWKVPYVKGGLPFNIFYNNIGSQQFLNNMYGDEVESVFVEEYRKYLSALAENNQDYLNQHLNNRLWHLIGAEDSQNEKDTL